MSCYICGRTNHIGRDCYFKNQSSRGGPGRGPGRGRGRGANQGPFQNKPGKQTRIKRSTENSGLFVTAQICEKNVKLLVDTGAILTILNTNLYNSVKSSLCGDSGLDAVRKEILSATNEPI